MGVLHVSSSSEFDRHLAGRAGVFVDFFAEWCGPCKMVSPLIESLATKYKDVVFLKVDVDQCQDIAARYGVRAMPTFIAFLDGEKVAEVVGAQPTAQLEALVQKVARPQAFSGQGNRVGSEAGPVAGPVGGGDAAAAREARARAAEARLAAMKQ